MPVLLFPGQGSQAPKMGEFLYQNFQIAKDTFTEASEAIGLDLAKLCFEGSESELSLTENTQPAILCVSIATFRVLKNETNLTIQAGAGHSIGEYAALVSAGTLPFSSAMKAVRTRGQAMQSSVPVGEGGMIAVLGLDSEQIKWLCQWTEKESGYSPISPANFNSPGQIVVSGSSKCLQWLKENFKPDLIPGAPKRAKLIPLNVSAPFHCQLMKPAQEKMAQVLDQIPFRNPTFPIIQNFRAQLVDDPIELKSNLISQVSAPVLWTQTMELMLNKGFTTGIECGHGQVLKGLFKKMDAEQFRIYSTQNSEDLNLIKNNLS
ncbi:MAG: ACP S-malonyltransferase [Deltaproteobacteria bacterium]|nr:ACP S-malonyltransferase [Deltaproteobacteria bacterium]